MRTFYLRHSTFSFINAVGYDPYNSSDKIMFVVLTTSALS